MRTYLREVALVAATTAAGAVALVSSVDIAARSVAPVAPEPAVLATVLDSLGVPAPIATLGIRELLVDSTLRFTREAVVERIATDLLGVHRETIDALRLIAHSPGDARTLFSDHPGIAWVPESFAHRAYPRDGEGVTYLRFSRVAFSRDTTQALLYVSIHCGALCGRGEFILLERTPGNTWRVRSRLLHVVS